jgi:transaldolase
METLVAKGGNLKQVSSVASFFLSRIDTLLDPILEKRMLAGDSQAKVASRLQGQVAIASVKVAYQIYDEIFGSDRFNKLVNKGAGPQ